MKTHKHFSIKKYLFPIIAVWSVFCIILTLTVFAATEVPGLTNFNIGLSYSGDSTGDWSADEAKINGQVSGTTDALGCSNDRTSTLTIQNNGTKEAVLSFSYTLTINGGSIKVAGSSVTSNGTYSGTVASGKSIPIQLTSAKGAGKTTKIAISNVLLVPNIATNITFLAPENGSYTVVTPEGPKSILESTTVSHTGAPYEVAATPKSGYKFRGWYNADTGECFSRNRTDKLVFEADASVVAEFVPTATPVFDVDGTEFTDLDLAVSHAVDNGKDKVTLVVDGTLSESYVIPSGITLLIPFDNLYTLYQNTPAYVNTAKTPVAYRTLTLASGSSITVNGAISVSGKHYASSSAQCSKPTGPYGRINMRDNSSIIVNSGGNLYAWGYITGSGTVTAKSGASVYEYFQITDWRGGNATSGMLNNSQKVFPFSQYYVQNIEAPLILEYGATEHCYMSVSASLVGTKSTDFVYIGNGNQGLFRLDSGATLQKEYIPALDRMKYTISGNAALTSISLTVLNYNINSASYVLPINSNITLSIDSGTVSVTNDIALLPGFEANIAQGAELNIASGASMYVYDADQWETTYMQAANNKWVKPVAYSPTKSFDRTTAVKVDAKVDVNGMLSVSGTLYTTASGADICSSLGSGQFLQQAALGTSTTTYQATQKDTTVSYASISITPAQLHNTDGSYTATAGASAGDTFRYLNGRWVNAITVTYHSNDGNGGTYEQVMDKSATSSTLAPNSFTREGYNFAHWTTTEADSGTTYVDGASVSFTGNVSLYAQWTIKTYTVTFNSDGGSAVPSQTVEHGKTADKPDDPTRDGSYTFLGWFSGDTSYDFTTPVTADLTLTARWASTGSVTISWGALHYEYTPASYQWNPEEGKLRYEKVTDSYWTAKDDGQAHDLETPGYIQVVSKGIAVNAALSFRAADGLTWPGMGFYLEQNGKPAAAAQTVFPVAVDSTVLIKARLTGDPDSGSSLSAATVGSITITLSRQE